ncbi:bacteriorhodopsin-like [Deinococcus marmoris]|uniref:bacteriorhodopsin-like n=1 Tax=Deinococcus marmoris TaxID=249408 RepID=UPI0009DCA7AC|nr:bacteriorhodopsin-like [Deinococcus marmoris]
MRQRFTPFTWIIATLAVLLGTALAQSDNAPVEAAKLSLSSGQFGLVYQMFSITIAAMGAGFLFFVLAQGNLSPKYRPAMVVSALVVAIACYHYFRIFNSWNESYALDAGNYVATAIPFNDAYRYADWILTVPLLLVEAVAVLALASNIASGMIWRLALAAFVMIATGYPGEISGDTTTRLIWGTISTIPFIYILYILFAELGKAIDRQPPRVQVLTRNLRLLLFASWGFYPIAYLMPIFLGGGTLSASGVVGLQVGYSIADILAKVGFGTLIYFIALEKTAHDRSMGVTENSTTPPATELPARPV